MPDTIRPASPWALFVAFSLLALQGFGGVIAIAQRVVVEQRRWLTKTEFLELLAAGQVLPGPNVVNLSLMIGDRFFGWRGALASMGGMILPPMAVVLPAALFARGMVRQNRVASAGAAMVGFFGWELVKIVLTVAMLAAAPKLVPQLSWLALLVGMVVTMKTYWIALMVRPGVRKTD